MLNEPESKNILSLLFYSLERSEQKLGMNRER
jgi:hypothetical protein